MNTGKESAALTESPFVVMVDQQEGLPYTFPGITDETKRRHVPMTVRTRTVHLKTGDYTIEGYADQMAIERKTLVDFCGSFGGDHDREYAKLERLARMQVIVIDAMHVMLEGGRHWNEVGAEPRLMRVIEEQS